MSDRLLSILNHPLIAQRYFFPQRVPLPDAISVPTEVGPLACWRSAPPSDQPVLLHFHGNGELVHHWRDIAPIVQSMGYQLFLAEYRGYGGSAGQPYLGAMLDDVPAIVEAVGVPADRIVVFGRSVGSIFAIEAAHRFSDIAGLVLESGISSVLERLAIRVEPHELGCTRDELEAAVRSRVDHHAKLSAYTGPLLVMHAEHDHLVGIEHAEENYASAASQPKELVRFPRGDHNSIMAANMNEYMANLNRFLSACT